MIDKKKLIDLLDDIGVIVNVPISVDKDGCGTYTTEGCGYVADRLIESGIFEQQPKVGQWIPVEERLPEENTRVLVYLDTKNQFYTTLDTDRLLNGRWVRWGQYVTHWKPIPEPYKPEKGESEHER